MAYNGSGVFERVYSWTNDKQAGLKIQAARMDQEMDGFAQGLSNCITRDGQSTITRPIPFNGQRITNLGDPASGTDAMNKQTADASYSPLLVGEFKWWGGTGTVPTKWLECLGQAVSRTTYSALFAAIGTTFGAGDGSSTFNLPDGRSRTLIGVDKEATTGSGFANLLVATINNTNGRTLGAKVGDAKSQAHNHDMAIIRSQNEAVGYGLTSSPQFVDRVMVASGSIGNRTSGAFQVNAGSGSIDGNITFAGQSGNLPPALVARLLIFAGV